MLHVSIHLASAPDVAPTLELVQQLCADYLWEASAGLDLHVDNAAAHSFVPTLPLFNVQYPHQQPRRHAPLSCSRTRLYSTAQTECTLSCSIDVADNLEDEWFALWVVRQVTLAVPGAVGSVQDEHDGDFCLVEAADVVPAWLEPDVSALRVWIFHGDLHLIDPRHLAVVKSPAHAVAFVRSSPEATRANATLQREAFARTKDFPTAALRNSRHAVRLSLPVSAARALAAAPELAPMAARAWIEDNDNDVGVLPGAAVACTVRFTRRSFAMLSSRADVDGIAHALSVGLSCLARANQGETRSAKALFAATCDPTWASEARPGEFVVAAEDDDDTWLDDVGAIDRAAEERFAAEASARVEAFMRGSGEADKGAEGPAGGPIEFDADAFFDLLAGRLGDEDDDAAAEHGGGGGGGGVHDDDDDDDVEDEAWEAMLQAHAQAMGSANPASAFMSAAGVVLPEVPPPP